ncbi:MAG: chromosome segregation protein SMC, partial [Acidobacteriota bacterium]|nr:chromosome segregation protein SMC [Acidobacteriota bacterium]
MLKLERLQIAGFKSFSDRTEVTFPAGITAVVGPNGCGKSNIGDAINWVLGEQSPKNLRGRHMADVIFSGSDARKPLGMAEVSLHFNDAQGAVGGESGKLVITRKLFRSGESEYRVNGARARLKDIQELLSQGHVGARSYATIEQGRIDQILNAKPKDRRQLIEDAAGIAGYKHKRRLAEMKLDATHANLLRVNDIIVEVERSIRSLKRQAAKARRYRTLRDELRSKERVRFALRAQDLDTRLETLRGTEAAAREAEAEIAAGLGKSEVQLVEQRTEHEQLQESFRELGEATHQLELETDRSEGLVKSCVERVAEAAEAATRQRAEAKSLTERLAESEVGLEEIAARVGQSSADAERLSVQWDEQRNAVAAAETLRGEQREDVERRRQEQFSTMNEVAELRNRLTAIEEGLQRCGAQRARTESELELTGDDVERIRGESHTLDEQCSYHVDEVSRLSKALAEAESGLASIRKAHDVQSEGLNAAREAEKSAVARLNTLEDVDTRFAGVSDGVRTLIHGGPRAGVRPLGVLADYVEAQSDVEGAAEGYLRNILPTVIMQDDADVEKACDLLRREGAGRTTMISKSHPGGGAAVGHTSNGTDAFPGSLLGHPGVRGRLRERLDLKTAGNGVVGDRIGDAVLVDTLTTALMLHRQYPGVDYLTASGDVVYSSGVVATGGVEQSKNGLLAHRRKSDEARQGVEKTRAAAQQAQRENETMRQKMVALEILERETRQALDEANHKRVELEAYARRNREDGERAGRKRETLDEEIAVANREVEELSTRQAATVQEIATVEGRRRTLEHDLQQATLRSEEQEAAGQLLAEAVSALRVELASRTEQLQAAQQEKQRLQEGRDELKRRVDACHAEASAADARGEEAARLKTETDATLLQQLEERRGATERSSEMERRILELQRHLGEMDSGLKTLRDRLEAERTVTRELELERTKLESE